MQDAHSSIRLPLGFSSEQASVAAAAPQDDQQFAACQIEFIQHLFGRSQFLQAHARITPLSDTFLSAFVTLIDVLVANDPAEAEHCVMQLRQILDATFPASSNRSKGPQ